MAQFPIGKRLQRVEPHRATQSIKPDSKISEQSQSITIPESREVSQPQSAPRLTAPRAGSFLVQSKLSTAPLAILLPSLGDLRLLPLLGTHLSMRHEAVFAGASAELDDTSDRDLRSEEMMLTQVLQWLAVSINEPKE